MNVEQLVGLCKQWHMLLAKIDKEGFFDLPLFRDTFSKTFEVLSPLAQEKAMPKDYMELFLAAYSFATHSVSGYCKEHDAAVDLTGKMLVDCGIIYADAKLIAVFDFELLRDIPYTDIDAAIAILSEKYAADYT